MRKNISDGQTKSLRAMNSEKEVDIAIIATASNMAWMEEQGTDGKRLGASDQERRSHR